eukprot:scaffold227614_cov17-Prasinocladus_malaysianus.AAC.2
MGACGDEPWTPLSTICNSADAVQPCRLNTGKCDPTATNSCPYGTPGEGHDCAIPPAGCALANHNVDTACSPDCQTSASTSWEGPTTQQWYDTCPQA